MGTSGWRGIFGEEVTFPRLRAALRGAAGWFREQGGSKSVLIGYDGRFASERMARMALAVLRSEGLAPRLSDRTTPTPVITSALRSGRAAGALVFTASHNPPAYHGMKVFGAGGGSIDDAGARRLEVLAGRALRGGDSDFDTSDSRRVDFAAPYRARLADFLDGAAMRRAGLRVVYDAMHGAGVGVLDAALQQCGVKVEPLRGVVDPLFGGVPPDPIPARLAELRRSLRDGRGLRLGIATDGDADRVAAVDERGRVLSETQVVAVLVEHLCATGRLEGGLAVSVATGSLVERVARAHGLEVVQRPIGFKHLSRDLVDGVAQAAGEESGGFALAQMGNDKDGILSGCLLAEAVAVGRRPVSERVAELEARHGRSACGRRALVAAPAQERALARVAKSPPRSIGKSQVDAVSREDGVRLSLPDGFLMLRRSGTEPVIRVYAEAPGPRLLQRRLDEGERLLGPSGGE